MPEDKEKTDNIAFAIDKISTDLRSEFSVIIQAANKEIDSINARLEALEERFSGLTFGYGEHLVAIDSLIGTLITPSSIAINDTFSEFMKEGRVRLMKMLQGEETESNEEETESDKDAEKP